MSAENLLGPYKEIPWSSVARLDVGARLPTLMNSSHTGNSNQSLTILVTPMALPIYFLSFRLEKNVNQPK